MAESPNDPTQQPDQPLRFPEIDGYDIIDLVGAGGMGMVYEAIQRSTGRRVAVKVMLESAMASAASRQRFEREVEFIARLDHPNIVAVLDSGIQDEKHFCVMDFVEGSLLDDALTPGECDPPEALAMIERIARAADYAHQRGVLHRDLKPANVLIDDQGEPHLLDFGLAKAIDPVSAMGGRHTISEQGQLIGTVAYMAPEQARGELGQLSVRTDVYALGAIAYELLTGFLPVEVSGSLGETLTRLESRDAARPSSIRKKLGGDTDAILLKALEKNPVSRYETAGMFADDIRRKLDGFPVRARRISPVARLGRWVNRNRKISAVIGVALITLIVVSSMSVIRILDEQFLTKSKEAELTKFHESLGPNQAGSEFTVSDLFRAYAEDLAANPREDPRVECEARQRLGHSFFGVRDYEQAELHQRRALELRELTGRGGREALAASLHELAATLWHRKKYSEAAPLYERALGLRESIFGIMHKDVALTMQHLALTYERLERHKEAEALLIRALDVRTQILGPDHEDVAASKMGLGDWLFRRDRFEEAEAMYRQAIELARRKRGNNFEGVAIGLTNLGVCLMKLDRYDEARETIEESLPIKEKLWGRESEIYAWSQYYLADVAWRQGDLVRAHRLAEESIVGLSQSPTTAKEKITRAKSLLDNINASRESN